MIRIAVVEDDPMYLKRIQTYLTRYEEKTGERFGVTCFSDGDEIVEGYQANYDIILMDIEMRFMDGMTAAQHIRKLDSEVVLIFVTNMPQYAIQGYAVDAMDYILKPVAYPEFSLRLDRAVSRVHRLEQEHGQGRKFLQVSGRSGQQKLDISRIRFVEVQGHSLLYHTADGVVSAPGSMREVEELLAGDERFFRCNKGYLVNLELVDAVREGNAVLGGEEVQISRSKKKAFLEALNRYINEVGK